MPLPENYIAVGTEIPLQPTNGPEWEKVLARLGNHKVLVLKCFNEHFKDEDGNVLLYRTGYGNFESMEYCHHCQILAVSDDCELVTKDLIGTLIEVPENNQKMTVLNDGYIIFDERIIKDPLPNHTQIVKPYVVVL